jgi:hypothetical protein
MLMSEKNSGQLEAAAEAPDKVEVTIDTSKIREEMAEAVKKVFEAKELEKPEGGTGEVSESVDVSERHVEIIENMKKGIKEQWTVAVPKTTKEAASHLRDYCFESNALEGKPGNTVNHNVG